MGADEPIDSTGGAAGRAIVVVSDVHLGTDAPTVWYQRDVHEDPFVHLLDWVTANAAAIGELVLLGDIVDLWTYPADERPPTFADIVANHPAVLGADGALARVLDALDGRVTYVPGNHDMGVDEEDLAAITSPGGHRIALGPDGPYFPLGPDDTTIALAHGHHHTLFNAPAPQSPWAPLPLGYFVTRAVATSWSRRLEPGATVADLAGQGAPNGIDLGSLGAVAGGISARSIGAAVLDFVLGATGVAPTEEVTMPDGTVVTFAQVRDAYANVWSDWVSAHGGGFAGTSSAYRSAIADFDGTYLAWFATQLAFEADTELVVMGHTHLPVSGLDAGPIRYANTGFDCPSRPDRDDADPVRAQRATFAVVDPDAAEATIWAVGIDDGGDLACRPTTAPRTRVVGTGGHDFSTYVTVENTGPTDLTLVASTEVRGAYVVPPPPVVPAGEERRFWIQDQRGPWGSGGSATYTDGDRAIELTFACPTLGTNSCGGWHELATRSGDGPWKPGETVRFGHPFFVRFTI